MPSQEAPLRINQFVGGLNTEANPLSFPINATKDELNLTIETNGVRQQRDAFDVEEGWQSIDTGIVAQPTLFIGRSQFLWENPGGESGIKIVVHQIGNYIAFHKVGVTAISAATLFSEVISGADYDADYNYAVVEGILVVTTGLPSYKVYTFDPVTETITSSDQRIRTRDFWETDAEVSGVKYNREKKIDVRPKDVEHEYVYCLRNGTYNLPRLSDTDNTTLTDPISKFRGAVGNSNSRLPSLADNLLDHYTARTSFTNIPTADRHIEDEDYKSRPSNTRSPNGYFVIDALERGPSRTEAFDDLMSKHSELTVNSGGGTLKADTTEGGVKVCADYAGRVWFSGFSSKVTGAYDKSPLLSSYLFFSQIVTDKNQIEKCYQAANPTDPYDNELVPSDGGYLRLSGAYDIKGMVSLKSSLFVFARNGVWRVSGVDGNSFDATGFSVEKVSEFGCVSGSSVVQIGRDVFFWGEEAIYSLTVDQISGDYVVSDITENTIKSFYDDITVSDKETVIGYHDSKNNAIRWLYGTELQTTGNTKELVLNVKFSAFTPNTLPTNGEVVGALSCASGFPSVSDIDYDVTVGGVQVTNGGVDVWVTQENVEISAFNSFYVIILDTTTTITYTFGGYRDDTHFDWTRKSGASGYLPSAYLITGDATGGQASTRKDTKYLNTFFPNLGDGGISCRVSARWGWSTDVSSGHWSSVREAYRYNTKYDNTSVIHTRNKVRGSGNALSFKFENDGVAPLYLSGWEFDLGANKEE